MIMCKPNLPPYATISDINLDPVSFVITCISLGLALKPEFRNFIRDAPKNATSLTWWKELPQKLRNKIKKWWWGMIGLLSLLKPARTVGNAESIELERETKGARYEV